MDNPIELSNFIRRAMEKGLSNTDIRATLKAAEWNESEINAALGAWYDSGTTGPVPRPVRSTAAKDALFYGLLFVAFAMVAGNLLTLAFGQIDMWMPEPGDTHTYGAVRGLRWPMAALIVFTPTFLMLDWVDRRALLTDLTRGHGTIQRWLSFLAMFIAATALMGDALYLIYTFLDGQMTARFLVKSVTLALLAGIILMYFTQDRRVLTLSAALKPAWILSAIAVLVLGLSFWAFGGPMQGKVEQRDRWRISDLRTLARNMQDCDALKVGDLPDSFDPMSCAENPETLTGYTSDVTYTRLDNLHVKLCIKVEFPAAVTKYNLTFDGNLTCIKTKIQ